MMLSVISAFFVSILYSYAYYSLYSNDIIIVSPMVWYMIIVLASIACIVFGRNKYKYFDNKYIVFFSIWMFVYIILCIASYVYSQQELMQYRIFKNTVYLAVITIFFIPLIHENIVYVLKGIYIVVLVSVMINISELLFPQLFYFSVTQGRSAGFYVNPNNSALYLVLGLVITIPLVNLKRRLYYSLFTMIGVLSTFSRGGFIIGSLSVIGLISAGYIKASKIIIFLVAFVAVITLLLMQLIFGQEGVPLDKYLKKDALIRTSVSINDQSLKGRLSQLNRGIDLMKESPIYGHGLGATRIGNTIVSPHNMFVYLGVEQGIVGIFLYISLLVFIFISGTGINKIIALVLFFGSFFSHNIYDYPATWIVIVISLSTIYGNKKLFLKEDENIYRVRSGPRLSTKAVKAD